MLSSKISSGGQVDEAKKCEAVMKKAFPLAFGSADNDDNELSSLHYPHVKYWLKATFTSASAAGADRTFGKRLQFLEDDNGQTISSERMGDIRQELANCFKVIKDEMPLLLAETWTICQQDFQTACCAHMRRSFKEFKYCSKNWKFRSLMTDWYSNFRRNRRQGRAGGNAVKDEEDEEELSTVTRKRAAAIPPRPRKKAKVEPDTDDEIIDVPDIMNPLSVLHLSIY